MDECRVRREMQSGELQLPVAYLTCNFNAPVGDKPALFTHDEVVTLFHEFGHGIHHMLTKMKAAGVSGINGVPWDAVELPSQFLENWCWEEDALNFISGHFETGEPLPADLLERMLAARDYQSAMQMVRQLEFSLFDFLLHSEKGSDVDVQGTLDNVREEVAVVTPPSLIVFKIASDTYLPVVMPRVTTVTNGLKCCRLMPIVNLKKTVFLIERRAKHFLKIFLKWEAVSHRWSCLLRLGARA